MSTRAHHSNHQYTRGYSHFSPFRGSHSKNRFVNRLSTSRLAGWHYTQGVENAALSCRRTCKAVQDTARLWKEWEVILSQFAGGRSSVGFEPRRSRKFCGGHTRKTRRRMSTSF